MGTNYYIKINNCTKCGRHEEIHLGKSSIGWQFTFRANYDLYKDVPEMREYLKDKEIKNEYGEGVSYKEFWEMVDSKQKKEHRNHAKLYPSHTEQVIDGYSFSDVEFS